MTAHPSPKHRPPSPPPPQLQVTGLSSREQSFASASSLVSSSIVAKVASFNISTVTTIAVHSIQYVEPRVVVVYLGENGENHRTFVYMYCIRLEEYRSKTNTEKCIKFIAVARWRIFYQSFVRLFIYRSMIEDDI
jgi:hypothetical protein